MTCSQTYINRMIKVFRSHIEYLDNKEESFEMLYKSENYCFSIWEFKKDTFELTYRNDTFEKIIGIEGDVKRYSIKDIYSMPCFTNLKSLEKIEENTIRFFYYSLDCSDYWQVLFMRQNDRIYILDRRMLEKEILSKRNYLRKLKSSAYDFSFDFEFTNDGVYTIIRYDMEFSRLFKVDKAPLCRKMNQEHIKQFDESFIESIANSHNIYMTYKMEINGICVYTILEILTSLEGTNDKMTALASIIGEEEFASLTELFSGRKDFLKESIVYGFARLELREDNMFYEYKNKSFEKILRQDKSADNKIMNSKAVKEALQCGFHHEEIILLRNQYNSFEKYNLVVTPILYSNKIIGLSVRIHSVENNRNEDFIDLVRTLTKREREVMLLASANNSNRDVAQELGISEGTVKRILHNGYKKLKISSRYELVEYKGYLKTLKIDKISNDQTRKRKTKQDKGGVL